MCFSHPLEESLSVSKPLAAALFAAGGFYGFRAEECDYYVCFECEGGPRIKSAASRGARILTNEEFAALTERDSVRG